MKCLFIFTAVFAVMNALPVKAIAQVQVTNHDDYFSGSNNENTERNVIKFGVFHVFCGEAPLFYERVLNDKMSVEACGGITFDYLLKGVVNDFNNGHTVQNFYFADALTYTLGYVFKADFRYYPAGQIPEGWYLSPQIRYKTYNISYKDIALYAQANSYQGTIGSNYSSYLNYLDIMGVIGYQVMVPYTPTTWDFYIGIGIRDRAYEMPTAHPYTGSYGYNAFYYTFTPKTDVVLYIPFGVLFGIDFD